MDSEIRIKIMQKNMNKMMARIKLLERMMEEHGWKMPLFEPEYTEDNGIAIA